MWPLTSLLRVPPRRAALRPRRACASARGDLKQFAACKGGFAILPDRSVVEVEGADATKLLHNLVTNEIRLLKPGDAAYVHFLNGAGKLLLEANAVLAADERWLLEVAAADQPQLLRHLAMYRLRSRVAVRPVPHWQVAVVLGSNASAVAAASAGGPALAFEDRRLAQLGTRALVPAGSRWPDPGLRLPQLPHALVRLHRMLYGVAEGPAELPSLGVSLEYNLELLNGVSFTKGCYIGQELTARTHHTGVIRKRVLACLLFDQRRTPSWPAVADAVRAHLQDPAGRPLLPPALLDDSLAQQPLPVGTELETAGHKKMGRVLAAEAGVALVLLRLEALQGPALLPVDAPNLLAVPLVPLFFPRDPPLSES